MKDRCANKRTFDENNSANYYYINICEILRIKYGEYSSQGWGPRMRHRFGYFTPDEVYGAVVANLAKEGCAWIDVGCGRDLFPDNPPLARILSGRCGRLVGVDPDDNLNENAFVHEKANVNIEDYYPQQTFDLVTMRMVAEHITAPEATASSLARLVHLGGRVVVYTVNHRSPAAVAARIVPHRLHYLVKRMLWKTEERDTFPVAYLMNSKSQLAQVFERHGFRPTHYAEIDDCRIFGRFRTLHYLELSLWKLLRTIGVAYPERCIIGIYERI